MGEIALAFSPIITIILRRIMKSEVSVIMKEGSNLDELMVSDLHCDYATLWHYGSENATMIDMHLKITEAKALYEALQEVFKVQAKGQSGDKSLPQAETSAT